MNSMSTAKKDQRRRPFTSSFRPYQTRPVIAYDIAPQLRPGKNVIAIWLGTSWSIFGPYIDKDKPNTPIVIAQAAIYNGSRPVLTIKTDNTWKTHLSPNRLLGKWDFGHMGGELYDASQEIDNWNTTACNEQSWDQAITYNPKLKLSAQMVEANRLFKEIRPVSISERRPDGSYRVDMGVNFAGFTQVKLKGSPGDKNRVPVFRKTAGGHDPSTCTALTL